MDVKITLTWPKGSKMVRFKVTDEEFFSKLSGVLASEHFSPQIQAVRDLAWKTGVAPWPSCGPCGK